MPIEGQAIQYGSWIEGVDYSRVAEEQSARSIPAMQNCVVGNTGEIEKRSGYTEYIDGDMSSTPTVVGCGNMRFSGTSSSIFAVAGNKFYEDTDSAWVDRTASISITAGNDNAVSWANAGGTGIFTNNVNPLWKWTAAAGNIAALDVDSRFTKALCVEFWDNRAWAGNMSSGTDRVWRSDAGDIETWAATAFYTLDQDVTGIKGYRNILTIHADDQLNMGGGIWVLSPTGNAEAPYALQKRADKGAVSHRAIVVHSGGSMIYMREDGVYEWDGNAMPEKISYNLDGPRYWDNINQARLPYSHAVDYPDRTEVWFWVPHSESQTNMNHVIIWNYRHRIWYGPMLGGTEANFTRASSALISDTPHAGGVSKGQLYIHDNGTNDNTASIDAYFDTSAPPPAGIGSQVRWLYARHAFDAVGEHDVTVTLLSPGIISRTEFLTVGSTDDTLGVTFTISASAIAGETAQIADTHMWGYDPRVQLRYRNQQADEAFTIRFVNLVYKTQGLQMKEDPGVE